MKRLSGEIDDSAKTDKRAKSNNDDSNGKRLSEMIRAKKKLSMKQAKFIVNLDDMKSVEKSIKSPDETEWAMPQFFVQDLQRVILFSTIGNKFRFFPRWCKILRPQLIKSITFVTINNLSELDYKTNEKKFKKLKKIFTNQVKLENEIKLEHYYFCLAATVFRLTLHVINDGDSPILIVPQR
jgi:hypothetical protein